jgi:hypothetical protein
MKKFRWKSLTIWIPGQSTYVPQQWQIYIP